MSGKRQKTQYSLALEPKDRGETSVVGYPRAEPFAAKPALESPAVTEQLMEKVCDGENLQSAWKRVQRNQGSPGVDGMTIDDAKGYLRVCRPPSTTRATKSANRLEAWRSGPESSRRPITSRRCCSLQHTDLARTLIEWAPMRSGYAETLVPQHLPEGSFRPTEKMTGLPTTCSNGEQNGGQPKSARREPHADSPLLNLPIRHELKETR